MRHSFDARGRRAVTVLAAPLHAQLGTRRRRRRLPPVDGVVAVVGTTPILRSDVEERVAQARASGQKMPEDSASQQAMLKSILDAIIDEELLVQKAKDEKVEVTDNDVNADVDKRMQTIRTRFTTEKEFRDELKKSGFGTVDEFRRWLADQSRRSQLQQKLFEKLRSDGKIAPAAVSPAEVDEFFAKNSSQLQKLPATVTLRQIVVAPKPSPKQDIAGGGEGGVAVRRDHEGRRLRADREARVDGSEHQGARRRSRLAPARRLRSRVRSRVLRASRRASSARPSRRCSATTSFASIACSPRK